MSLGKRLFIGGEAAAAAGTSETVDVFGDSSGIALYTLDYDASDESGNYDGTPSNVTFGVDGEINWGASFNGSSSYVNVTHNSSFNWTNNKTISLWVNFDTINSGNTVGIAAKGANSSNFGWYLYKLSSDDKIYFQSYNTSDAASTLDSGVVPIAGNWYHICVTGDSSTNKIYINGVEKDSASAVTATSTNDNLIFGRFYSNVASNHFEGKIDQVRFFTKALSSDEVSTLYEETATVHTATTDTLNYQATNRAYYKFDNNALDETSNNHDGTENSITYEFGRYGAAADFNGSSSYISVAHNSAFNWTNNKTLSVWVKFDVVGSLRGIVAKGSGSAPYGWVLYMTSTSKIQFVQYNSLSQASTLASSFTAVTNKWYHVCVTGDGTTNKLYIDGSLNHSAVAVTATNGTDALVFGRLYSDTNNYYHSGQIDQLRFYESTLDATAVANLYNEKQAYITKNASNPFGDGDEEAFYKFDNNTNDSTGSYNMTNRNITFSTDSAIGTHSGEFNGASSEGIISSTTTTPIDFSAEDFTISFWAKVDNFTNTVYPLSKWGSNATNDRAILTSIRSTGYEDFSIYEHNGSTYFQMTHSKSLEADRWHHFAYTRNGSTGTLYVDGIGESFARTNTIKQTSQDIFIGNAREDTTNWFDGHIDSMRLFSRCLDGDEIFKLYAEVIN